MSQIDDFLSGKTPESSPQSIDDFLGTKPKPKKKEDRGVLDTIADLGLSVWEGAKGTARSMGAAGNTVTGDLADVEGYAADQRAAAEAGPQAKRDLLDEIERRKKADTDPGVLSAIKNVGVSMLSNPEGSAQFVAEQAPNSAVALGAGWAGAKGGALAGSAFGPVGTAVGGVAGFLGGMFLGNTLLETGSKAMEKAKGGFTEAERGEALSEGATKGAVITGVDALTLGVGGKVAKGLNKAAIDAGARAEAQVLANAGVDVTSRAAIEQALVDPALREAAKVAGQTAAKDASTMGSKAATAGTGLTMETVGEGTGEYLGELAATGKADVYDAVMEAAAGFTQSAPETAWNMRQASGNNLDSRGMVRNGAEPITSETGTPPATPPAQSRAPVTSQSGASPESAMVQSTEAEKALRTPVSLTALDRVNEIDGEISRIAERAQELTPENGYGPAFDQERAELTAKAQELAAERTGIAQTWPKAEAGAPTSFSTEAGARLDAQYAIMDAADLVTSHDESLRPNGVYPQELQPRDRSRSASEMQVSSIVQKLDPARLGLSADAATGAPIVGADGLVESGNARTIALKRVYQANGQKAEDYKGWLRENAGQFGLNPEAVDGMSKPVLVRVRTTPVNRAEFARQANASTVQRMSPSEQALSDSKRLASLEGLNPDDAGDFTTSYDFIRQFMGMLPITEQSDMVESDGRLSTFGYRRIQNAVLAKAYGDSPTLRRMTESMDDNLRNVTKALVRVAPTIAGSRERMQAGTMYEADIAPDLLNAVEGLSALKEKGWSVADELGQGDLTGAKYSPEAAQLLALLSDNIRSPRRIAEFVQRYYEALEAAGDPSQASIFGDDGPAPARADLLKSARGNDNGNTAQDTQRRDPGEGARTDAQGGRQPENAPGNRGGDQGDGAARAAAGESRLSRGQGQAEQSEWVMFPADTGTIGIPRAKMPQVKSEHRGALIQFLQGKGIEHETFEREATDLKPTQAEFSTKKAGRWKEVREGVDRSVLASSDGYVLDGHHQWVSALAMNEPLKVIQFDAPIRDLLAAVYQFPSVQSGEGATTDKARAQARQDFKDAMADLAMIATKHTRLMMVPEKTPNLMPTLVKLMEAGIKEVGYNIKDLVAYVKGKLKSDPELKTFWNKVTTETYRKAAEQAMASESAQRVDDLFAAADANKGQQDLFGNALAEVAGKPKQAMINGRPYDMKRDNFVSPHIKTFLAPDVIAQADGYVEKYYKNKTDPDISKDDVARAKALLEPLLVKAADAKAEYDQKIIDIAKATGALGQMIAPLKSLDRAVPKLVVEEQFNIDGMKDMLRSTIVVSSYADAQAVFNEIVKNFELTRKPKNRTGDTPITYKGEVIQPEDPAKFGGYSDLMVNVRMPNGVIAEIQINVPEMLGAKEGPDRMAPGHKLYEAYRDAPKESPLGQEILRAMLGYYAAAYSAASERSSSTSLKKSASDRSYHSLMGPRGPKPGLGLNDAPSAANANQPSSGNSTKNPPSTRSANRQPGGNLSGTFISTPLDSTVPQLSGNGYTGVQSGENNANDQPGQGRAQGKGTTTVSQPGGKRATQRVRPESGGTDLFAGGDADAGAADQGGVGQAGSDGVRGKDADGKQPAPRTGARRDAGVPAGRDIPAKSGRNYAFGPADLTYEGSWFKKAEQNVEALELLLTLEKDGRQATRDEQAKLAKFIGWGASEIANNLFGKKLDSAAEALANYEEAIRNLGDKPYLTNSNYNAYAPAFRVLQFRDEKLSWYTAGNITREMLDKAKPDASTRKWVELRDRMKAAMSEQEFAEASRSTQYAHYTSKEVVRAMWGAMERMGFKGGAVLEPGAGIGVFPGLMPATMAANSIYTGIEYDSITGRILKQLFPDERILVESFVDSKLPKNFYDVAAGNPPFSGTKILGDPEYAKRALSLHDYFFAKSIDRVKPGGLVMYVTSRYTMDKLDDKARKYLAERADLVGAIRLPQTAFKQNAGTEVVTDVIFLRKKVEGETFEHAQPWLGVAEVKGADGKPLMVSDGKGEKPAMINEYFAAHPEMVLGQHANTGSMYADKEYTVTPMAGDIEAHFAKAVENLPEGIYKAERGSSAEAAKVREIDFNPKAKKEGNYYVSDAGVLMVREGGVGQRVELRSQGDVQLIKDFVPLRDALKQAHYDQLNDGDWETSIKALQKAYADFTKKHGQVNQFTLKSVKTKVVDEDTGETYTDETQVRVYTLLRKLEDDPDYTLVAALETINDDTGEIKPSAFLTERVLGKPDEASISTPHDALLSSLNDVGNVDIPLIAQRLGLSEAETIEALGSAIYEDPASGWVTADEYTSGNVKRKLDEARTAAKTDKRFERNVTALEAAQPAPKTPSQINVGIGMNWVPGQMYGQFLRELAGVRAEVTWNERTKQWSVQELGGGKSMQATADWGTEDRNASDILEHALTGRPIRITKSQGYGKDKTTVFDAAGTEAANQKLEAMREAFGNWIWKDAERTDTLVRIYNDTFNTTVPRSFDGRHLTLPGSSKAFSVFDHVKRGAWRIIQRGNTYLAHAVGSGKTFQMVISAMEQKRLGLIKKPMIVVPNHMLKQFAHEWQMLYPAARLMVADEKNFHTDNRRRFVSRVALSDLDGVVITHSAFKLLDLDPEFKRQMIEEQLDYMRAALEEAESEDGKGGKKSPRIKQIEKQIENMEQKLEAAMASTGKDANVRFDELGVDMLYVDEAHEYRKLDFTTSRQVKGISPQGSARAFDLYMKARYLEQKKPGRSLVMASGTPVTNTLAELYTVQKFMDRQALEDRGIEDFDSWASMFGRERTVLEPNAAGKYEPVTRFSKFVNVPELTQMFREFADVLTSDNLASLLGDKRPKVEGGSRNIVITPKTDAYADFQDELNRRVQISRDWKPTKDEPNNPDPMIRIIGDGRLAAIDMRFIDPSLPSDPDSKLNRMIDDVIRVLTETKDMEYRDKAGKAEPNKGAATMVFSDLGFGAGVAANRGFNARAWFEKRLRDAGVPMNQVAFMSDYKKSADKLKLFKDVNAGRVRLLVGSSKNMGTGVNAQQRLKALFHLDSPWYPADLEQREGRIVRQGNKNPLVQLHAYAAKGTYDENMWKMLASKQFFIDQALSGDANLRELEDLDSQSQYDLAAAMVAEDPRILQLAGARAEIEKLQRLYRAHEDQRYRFKSQHDVATSTVQYNEKRLPEAEKMAAQVQDLSGDKFRAKVMGKTLAERADWADALIAKYKDLTARGETKPLTIGEISGFPVVFGGETVAGQFMTKVMLGTPDPILLIADAGTSPIGVAMRAQNAVSDVARLPAKMRERITEAKAQIDALTSRLESPFPMAGMLADKVKEANELEDMIASDSKPKTWRVENKASGLGFDVQATNADEAITKAVSTNGGAAEDWMATEASEVKPAEDTRLSRGAGAASGGVSVDDLDAMVRGVKATMPNMPKVTVLADPSKAPKGLREYIIRQDAWDDVEGAFHEGGLYLFASGLSDMARAEHVLLEHEAAHFGLRALLGDSLKTAMALVSANNANVRRAAFEIQKRGNKMSTAEAVEEAIVDIPTAQLAKLKGWRKVTGMVRDWLLAHGYKNLANKLSDLLEGSLTQQQRADLFVAELVRGAREYVAGKSPVSRVGYMGDTRLSTTLKDDIERQEKWLQTEARARGFTDVEDMLAKDYPLFERLAAKWREKNPADGGVLLSRAPNTKAVYDARIDALFAGEKAKLQGVRVLDRTELLGLLGYADKPVNLAEGKVIAGQSSHPKMTADVWKKIPEWLDAPAAVFDSDTEKGRLVFVAPELVAGSMALIIIDPKAGALDAHLLLNAYDKDNGNPPIARWMREGLARYVDKKKFPTVLDASGLQLPGTAFQNKPGTRQILTEKNLNGYLKANPTTVLSRAGNAQTATERANHILAQKAGSRAPLDALAKGLTRITGIERLTGAIYDRAGYLLDRYTPETIKAGVVADYGVPQAVIDQRVLLQGRQRVQLRKAGELIEKLSTLTREESRVAYEWMNMDGADPKAYVSMMQGLPEESVKVLQDVQKMIDQLSREAVRLGQLSPEAYEANKYAYLRRSYAKHILEQTAGEKAKRARVISILGDQYKGRGLTEAATMAKLKNTAPEWWGRKLVKGKADAGLKGEKFVRLERRAASGEGTKPLEGMEGKALGKLLEVAYWPAGEAIPSQYSEWSKAGTFEVRDVKGENVIFWRDFTKDERETMGEVDEARFAIAKTLHGMIHDVEVGRYLEWMAHGYALKEGETIPGEVVEASERYRDTFKPGEWVRVPDTKISGTSVAKYGKLAGRYLPGPVWNDLRQVVNGQFKPFGDTYAQILSMWKTAKTALSPAVHMNNVMSNFVMADWHDVGAAHVAKSLRLILAASQREGQGALGGLGNQLAKAGIADREAAREILNRYTDSGGDVGSWVTNEIAKDQLEPLLAKLEQELAATGGQSAQAEVGVMSALQNALMLRFPTAWEAFKGSKPGKVIGTEANSLIDLYQAEDDVFRLAAWLKAKEEGATDIDAGKASRRSFLDYHINAPWIQAMRQSAWPFISFTYRAVPMLAEIAGKKPHKLMKLMMLAGALNALGGMLAGGGDDDEERKLLPEEKAGKIWGMVPKLIRMPWNDQHGSPVYLDIRRFIPVGDVFDVGAGQAAVPVLPGMMPGGPLVLFGEVVFNKSAFTGKPITLDTDTPLQKAEKVADHLYKAFAPNVLGLPGTYATTGVVEATQGRTDPFGREMSVAQAVASSFGVKLGSYPADVLRRNLNAKAQAEIAEVEKNIAQLKRQRQTNRISQDEFQEAVQVEVQKKTKIMRDLAEKVR